MPDQIYILYIRPRAYLSATVDFKNVNYACAVQKRGISEKENDKKKLIKDR